MSLFLRVAIWWLQVACMDPSWNHSSTELRRSFPLSEFSFLLVPVTAPATSTTTRLPGESSLFSHHGSISESCSKLCYVGRGKENLLQSPTLCVLPPNPTSRRALRQYPSPMPRSHFRIHSACSLWLTRGPPPGLFCPISTPSSGSSEVFKDVLVSRVDRVICTRG